MLCFGGAGFESFVSNCVWGSEELLVKFAFWDSSLFGDLCVL